MAITNDSSREIAKAYRAFLAAVQDAVPIHGTDGITAAVLMELSWPPTIGDEYQALAESAIRLAGRRRIRHARGVQTATASTPERATLPTDPAPLSLDERQRLSELAAKQSVPGTQRPAKEDFRSRGRRRAENVRLKRADYLTLNAADAFNDGRRQSFLDYMAAALKLVETKQAVDLFLWNAVTMGVDPHSLGEACDAIRELAPDEHAAESRD